MPTLSHSITVQILQSDIDSAERCSAVNNPLGRALLRMGWFSPYCSEPTLPGQRTTLRVQTAATWPYTTGFFWVCKGLAGLLQDFDHGGAEAVRPATFTLRRIRQ